MDISRRGFVKATAVALASAAAAGTMSSLVDAAATSRERLRARGRNSRRCAVSCGCGCGVICEVKDNKLVSVTGDPDNQSNKGPNCVKGYYLAKILHGTTV